MSIFLYIILAIITSVIFRFIVGLATIALATPLLFIISGFKYSKIDEKAEKLFNKHRKIFLSYPIVLNSIIGSLYAFIVYSITLYFINVYGMEWIFIIMSLFWAASIFGQAESFNDIVVLSSLGGIISIHLGFGILITFIISILYGLLKYFGKVNEILKEEHLISKIKEYGKQ